MELAGLEPATSWVRSTHDGTPAGAWYSAFKVVPSVRPNIFPNTVQAVCTRTTTNPTETTNRLQVEPSEPRAG
jgi:hypothetical protein